MPNRQEIALMAHLMRRAGFGEPRWELDARTAKGYEAVVEELLHLHVEALYPVGSREVVEGVLVVARRAARPAKALWMQTQCCKELPDRGDPRAASHHPHGPSTLKHHELFDALVFLHKSSR